MSELVEALPATGLRHLEITDMPQVGGALPEAVVDKCAGAEYVDLVALGLTGGVPASFGKCAKLEKLLLHENQLEGAVPATELAALTALTFLGLNQNEGLTITASGAHALKKALPNAKLWLPKEVAG